MPAASTLKPDAPRRRRIGRWAALALIAGGWLGAADGAAAKLAPVAVDRMDPNDRTPTDAYGRVRLRPGAQVLVVGDSYVGSAADLPGVKLKAGGRARPVESYASMLKAALGPGVTVVDRTQPGARMLDTLKLFPATPWPAAIVVSFGWAEVWGQPAAISGPQYSNQARRVLEAAAACGCPVLVIPPPPVDLSPTVAVWAPTYRGVVRARADEVGAQVVTPSTGFKDIKGAWSDKVHLGPGGSRALANFLSARFAVAPSAQAARR